MHGPRVRRVLAGAALLISVAACRPAAPPRQVVTVARPAGSWQGRGNATLGFVSDSGRLRITWEAHADSPAAPLKVTVHSAVSGRPLKLVLDHYGDGRGVVTFDDDPRAYNLMVESANVDWSLSVDEFVGVYQDGSATPPH